MPLGQGFLNAWVKVNSKHVVIPSKNDRETKDGVVTENAGKGNNAKRSGGTASVKTALTTTTNDEGESQVIRRFNNRKNRRGLHRTVSATDLIRDKATVRGDKKLESESALEKSVSSRSANGKGKKEAKVLTPENYSVPSSTRVPRGPQHEEYQEPSLGTEGSLRFVAEFFGADLESLGASSKEGKFDPSSVQIGPSTLHDTISVASRDGHSLPARPSRKKANNNGGGIGIRFPPNIFAGESHTKDACRQCNRLQDELMSAREDLEYLRGVALRNEYTCVSCQLDPTTSTDATSAQPESISVSQALNKVVIEHEAQIEALKAEGVSVARCFDFLLHDSKPCEILFQASTQQELHIKLQKYASLCKDLNEEAEFRNEEALNLHIQLDSVRSQRDEMGTELEKLRALLADYVRNDQERRKSEVLLQQYEQKGLDGVDREIKTRDAIIGDLATRLERALDCLTFEREKQRQRRRIIFPNQGSVQNMQGRADGELEAKLRATRDSLHHSQRTVEVLRLENTAKEIQWIARVEELEKKLELSR